MSGANIDNEVYIVGGGMTEFGRFEGEDQELAEQAMREALADCNLSWADVDFAVGGTNGETKPDNIILSVNAQGQAYLYDAPVRSNADLIKQLQTLAEKTPQPEVQIRGDAKTDFEAVGRVLYAAQVAGLTKVRFVTDPQGLAATAPQGK